MTFINNWLQSFTRRKVLAYLLAQLVTFAILSVFSLSTVALFAFSAAMPFALDLSFRLAASILNDTASLFSHIAEQAPSRSPASTDTPPNWPPMLQINAAILSQNSARAIQLINQLPLELRDLQNCCRQAISANNTAVFEHMIALPQFEPHLASDNNQLLRFAITMDRCTMVNTLLRNQRIQNTADSDDNTLLDSACMRGSLPMVEAFLGLPNVVRELQRKSDTCIGIARLYNHREIEQRLIEASGRASPYQAVDRLPTLIHDHARNNRRGTTAPQQIIEPGLEDSRKRARAI